MMQQKPYLSILHYYLYDKIASSVDRNRTISTEAAKLIIGRQHNFPKPLRIIFLNELASNDLIKWINRDTIQVKVRPFDTIYNIGMLQKEVEAQ